MGEQARPMPTGPGWWWAKYRDDVTGDESVEVIEIEQRNGHGGRLWCIGYGGDVTDHRLTWLAPIPGPATCAALAEAGDPSPEVLRCLPALLELAEAVDAAAVVAEEFAILDTTANGRALERARDIVKQCLADYRAARAAGAEGGGE